MLRQKPHQRLVLFGTDNLTWMILHDGFLECHIGPSPSVGGYVLSNLEPEDRRGHQFAIPPLVRVTTVVLPLERPSELPTGEQDSSFYATCGVHGIDALSPPRSKYLESEPFPREIALQCRVTRSWFAFLGPGH